VVDGANRPILKHGFNFSVAIERNPIPFHLEGSNFLTAKELRTEEEDMHAIPPPNSAIGRTIEARLTSRSLTPRVLNALQALGYSFSPEPGPADSDPCSSGIWLVDEERIDEVNETEAEARILLISSTDPTQIEDPRIVSTALRPVQLSAVYSMIQLALEESPRMTPRVRTHLSARCIRADRRSVGAVLSLSEGGCLLRTTNGLRKGAKLDLQFALPEFGLVSTPARCRYIRKGDAGLEFFEPELDLRQSIGHFVTARLAETFGGEGLGGFGNACPA
jgi:hypothetical protein